MILFLDTEFGQIYGSWRRDFILTEIGLVYIDKYNNHIKSQHLNITPNIDLVFRESLRLNGKYHLQETVLNLHQNKAEIFNSKFKISKLQRKSIRKQSYKYTQLFTKSFKNIFKNVDTVVLFGGEEDIKLIKSLGCDLALNYNIIDLQEILIQETGLRLSLKQYKDAIKYHITNKFIYSKNFKQKIPNNFMRSSKKYYVSHNSLGDASVTHFLFLEMFSKKNQNFFNEIKEEFTRK